MLINISEHGVYTLKSVLRDQVFSYIPVFDPDEYESSVSETDEDSEGEPETDLTHIDLKNIVEPWTAPAKTMK